MNNKASLRFAPPSLPSGGGAISGLKEEIAGAAPDGGATLTLPLPVSSGRGYAPALTLNYHSRTGNGAFGIGWNIHLPAIRRRIHKGTPAYNATDEFIGTEGEVLVPVLTSEGTPQVRSASSLLKVNLNASFMVYSWRTRIETSFSKLEYWMPENPQQQDFWVQYGSDGQVFLFSKNPHARIDNPDNPTQTAIWLVESSVSANGEQIFYQYRAEDETSCDEQEKTAHNNAVAQRYLTAAWYGNRKAARALPALIQQPDITDWLFALLPDYGECGMDITKEPAWITPGTGDWLYRQDSFSCWEYGFEVRTRRLCRQILMYHAVSVLSGQGVISDTPTLVTRLWLEYQESPAVAMLKAVRQVAYEADGTSCALPPLEFSWQQFAPPEDVQWHLREDMGRLNLLQPYQMIDLNGEGMAGILYQSDGSWCYRAPERQPGADSEAVTWGDAAMLPSIPALQKEGMLADLDGDGYLEWIVTLPGVVGHYHRTSALAWQRYMPLSAFPAEFMHPQMLLADISGDGFTDVVLVGPKHIRLYAGQENGWKPAQTVIQPNDVTLPIPGADARALVTFSDIAGSGQQHLVEIRAEQVRYWPNLGHGRFGSPVNIPGFNITGTTFNPQHLYLADIDSSGTTDLIYAHSDAVWVYRNQSGNSFAQPFCIRLPDGVRYDRTTTLQLTDIKGTGGVSLLLTLPTPEPRHWVCTLSEQKSGLLATINNNMGARHTLHYRSSAQFWLDEKAEALAAGKSLPSCHLPFAMQLLQRKEECDEITGNQLVSTVHYRHGVWDCREREFRGFGFVEVCDSDILASQGTAQEITMPAISRSWYATGINEVDCQFNQEYWQGDSQAFSGFTPRFTCGSGTNEQLYTPDNNTAFWLDRATKGIMLRSELYGLAATPYTVTESRPQIRLVESQGAYPVVWPVTVEQRTYIYEQISIDPQCSQQVWLASDEYGQQLCLVNINYPRRDLGGKNPYPDTLPDTLLAASYDDQQLLRLSQKQNSWHSLTDGEKAIWLMGLLDGSRTDVFAYPPAAVPVGGFTLELLAGSNSPLVNEQACMLAGQQRVLYLDEQGAANANPAFPPRVAFTENAVLEVDMISALEGHITEKDLIQANYVQSEYLFPRQGEVDIKLWVMRQGYATYAAEEHFWREVSWRDTLLTGAVTLTRDANDCVIIEQADAAGCITQVRYDWRFLLPIEIIDVNDNSHIVSLDAFGRVVTLRFKGTENAKPTGYSCNTLKIPGSTEAVLALKAPLPVHQCMHYSADSWMKTGQEKMPPHVVMLTTDRYDNDPAQHILQQVIFSDGFGRLVQTAVRQDAGEALQRADDGSLNLDEKNKAIVADSVIRWAVSGRTEYDNKGQPVRTYHPWFLDSWKYVSDDSARQELYADTHYYDPLGRVHQVKTAKNFWRRCLITPWFIVNEDENDTASESNAFF